MKPELIIPGQVYYCASDDCQIVSCRARVKEVDPALGHVLIQEIGSMLPTMPRPRWVRWSDVFRPVDGQGAHRAPDGGLLNVLE